jgi:hypothetical protein
VGEDESVAVLQLHQLVLIKMIESLFVLLRFALLSYRVPFENRNSRKLIFIVFVKKINTFDAIRFYRVFKNVFLRITAQMQRDIEVMFISNESLLKTAFGSTIDDS